MINAKVNIGGQEVELLATGWTWIVYKRIFKRDWNADRNKSLAEIKKANLFNAEYKNLTDEQFKKLSKEKQNAYWEGLSENTVDMDFVFDTIYAMAVASGYKGTQEDLFKKMSPKELSPESELMKTFSELCEEFNIELKKNIETNKPN